MLGVAVIGAGRVAHAHARAIARHPRAKIISVVDPDPVRAEQFAHQYGAELAASDLTVGLSTPGVTAAVICAPTQHHRPLALTAIGLGKHVLVEKPLGCDHGEVAELVRAAATADVALMSGQVLRFVPMFGWARSVIAAGGLGRPLHVVERRWSHRPVDFDWWGSVPNFLLTHWGSHSVDLVLHLLGVRPVDVVCDATSGTPGRAALDDLDLLVGLEGGGRAAFHLSFLARRPAHDLVIIGEEGTLTFHGVETAFRDEDRVWSESEASALDAGFAAQLEHFAAAVRGDVELQSSGASVYPSFTVLDAAACSLRDGERVRISH
ncbi:MAG: Gfo/Idh/MocA family protein [Propionibacteriaceae bacterium]